MTEKQIQILLVLASLVGGAVVYTLATGYLKSRKRAIIETDAVWGYYKLGSTDINDDDDDDYSGLIYVDTLAKAFGTTREEFFEVNASLNPKITSLPYGINVLVPQIKR
jgi:hypothetical protein